MKPKRIEQIERVALEMVVQALRDYQDQATTIFSEETDHPQDIAEDILRDAVASMGLPELHLRLYGKVDVKKAIYVFGPEAEPVALMLDVKVEKGSSATAAIQMSQTSMSARMIRSGTAVAHEGGLGEFIERDGHKMLVVTIIVKFVYSEDGGVRKLEQIIVACIPNGSLQDTYNPDATDTIWRAGRNAPTRGEDFRVRLSFGDLQTKAGWRVRELDLKEAA